ncbi:NUDIX hydrolase [Dokdonella fugitiva]|jgi:8-oxo-dGTP pyrophosphatase MutT (NUDIX family)|uniref:NUDIX domain-containing protein n=1 Tax=Dokdonella fugitiva TaxID=328517 RepID=A0A4R2I8T9_9GAMM|nr:NUDIX hydrolase [Dokdonella fugitiva]MBA8884794.1 8-oxo-dGTP pyrophosphatase MutT (NUDIX family) [Dokdonella fugitiva]TCO40811.1 NUDIX domain-containing protein [Dokdonella fugitiva]
MSDDAAPRQSLLAHQLHWLALLDAYAAAHPDEHEVVACFRELLSTDAHAARRERREGHLTGAAWLVSGDGARVLLTHHRKLDRWLQLGGHADGDADLARVALREAEEESGLTGLELEPAVFDLDRHRIPARGAEPEHWHYDVRFVVHARGSEAFVVGEESFALAWRDISAIAHDPHADVSLRRMARKWLARGG